MHFHESGFAGEAEKEMLGCWPSGAANRDPLAASSGNGDDADSFSHALDPPEEDASEFSMYVCETKFYRRQGCSGGDSTAALPNVSYVRVPVPATGASHVLFKTR